MTKAFEGENNSVTTNGPIRHDSQVNYHAADRLNLTRPGVDQSKLLKFSHTARVGKAGSNIQPRELESGRRGWLCTYSRRL
jgi:hypothetical protein